MTESDKVALRALATTLREYAEKFAMFVEEKPIEGEQRVGVSAQNAKKRFAQVDAVCRSIGAFLDREG
jgi:hypothetical protein